jgi:DNA polymerase elongation subunit (family B)
MSDSNITYTPRKGPRLPVTINSSESIRFNTVDWFDDDMTHAFDEEERQLPLYNREHNKEFNIFSFGVTEAGNSVCCRIVNYHPYFYVMIPPEFDDKQVTEFVTAFDAENINEYEPPDETYTATDEDKFFSKYYKSALVQSECEIIEREIFWKFMNRAKFRFYKLVFTSKNAMNFYFRTLLRPIDLDITGKYKQPIKYNLFEADLEPLLRFYHDRDIKPAGWLECASGKYTQVTALSKCQINITCQWDRIIPIELDVIAPIRIASFDIEADSSHGDFPIARKDCKKLANQLVIAWLRDLWIIEKETKSSGKYIEAEARLERKSQFFADRIKKAVMIPNFAHVDDDIDIVYLKGCYAQTHEDKMRAKCFKPEFMTMCDEIYNICDRDIKKVKADKLLKAAMKRVEDKEQEHIALYGFINIDDLIEICRSVAAKFKLDNPDDLINKIVAKDAMVKFVNNKLNYFFGKAYGDRVIQIGTVFWEYGDTQCFHHNIITLKKSAPFNVGDQPCEIISYDYRAEEMTELAEAKVLFAWTDLIDKYDPDIIVGYNIHGFDMSFMFDRALEIIARYEHPTLRKEDKYMLQKHERFQKFLSMGRLHPEIIAKCENARGCLVNKKLSSSALGDNFLFYFNTPGRVQIDLLKVAQSSMTKLPSYKLDDVSSFYLSGKIKKFYPDPAFPKGDQTHTIKVTNINEIDNGNYVIISMANTGQQLYDGEKIAIREIDREHETLTLDKPIPTDCMSGGPLWGLAKDDVSAKDIFQLQKGTDADRGIVAKYCIQDCVLLVRLLRKLEVITNNVGMSNVCLIPFSYIFLRGQGIKIFSLVVNETAKNGYVLPTLEKVLPEEQEVDESARRVKTNMAAAASTSAADDGPEDDIPESGQSPDGEDGSQEQVFQLKSDFNVIKVTEDGYEGAIVLTPKPNIYFEPITVLDFASLYPSEMIASDLSHDRIIEDECWLGDEGVKRLDALGYDVLDRSYDNYSWVDPKNKNKGKYKNGVVTIRFVQTRDGSKGLMPRILQKLLTARKKKKKEMEAATDPFKKTILEGLQLAYKLTANSLYGQIGAQTSKIYKKAIAASTTAGGRINIYKAKDFVLKNNPGCEVVYGDSIPSWETVTIRVAGTDRISKVSMNYMLHEYFTQREFIAGDKEYYTAHPCTPIEAYTETGWTPVIRLMRHLTTKDIYKITIANGSHVSVTADHSIILESGEICTPTDLVIGQRLMTYDVSTLPRVALFEEKGENTEYYALKRYIEQYSNDSRIVSIEKLPVDNCHDKYVYDFETENHHYAAGMGNIIVHNTDSVFVKLNLVYPDGTYPEGREAKIQRSIDIGLKLQQQLKDEGVFRKPHDLEYEKVFYPLILITKKRYIGIKYEFDPKEGKKTSMGVVTKRRDNAPILKHTFNGVVDTLTQECNLTKAIKFVQDTCRQMVDGMYDLNMFVISKTLREYYKDPESIAHKVLAMRMGERDPGTKPASNERIPYVYIKIDEKPGVEYLQGDRIEHINYVREHKSQVDYQVYIMNQLMKPISQIFELVVELLPGYPYAKDPAHFANLENYYYNKFGGDLKKTAKKISDIKKELVQRLVFQQLIDYAERKISKRVTLDKWFAPPQSITPNDDGSSSKKEETQIDISQVVSTPKGHVQASIKKTKQGTLNAFFKNTSCAK